jgi:hypothetical protein
MNNPLPLVSIGIPTYNRCDLLARAIDSVLGQSYRAIEVIVSDNASVDDTERVCREFSLRDSRLRYHRAKDNQGPIWNFSKVLRMATGEYFMWLADDDWIDVGYVAACLSRLSVSPDVSLVGGRSEYIRNGAVVELGSVVQVCALQPWHRVFSYYTQVSDNGIFYGLMRKWQVEKVPLRCEMASDWLLVGGLAFQGKIETLDEVKVHRELGGATASFAQICRTLGLPRSHAIFPELTLAFNVARDALVRGEAFSKCPTAERTLWASLLFVAVFGRQVVVTLWRRLTRICERFRCRSARAAR